MAGFKCNLEGFDKPHHNFKSRGGLLSHQQRVHWKDPTVKKSLRKQKKQSHKPRKTVHQKKVRKDVGRPVRTYSHRTCKCEICAEVFLTCAERTNHYKASHPNIGEICGFEGCAFRYSTRWVKLSHDRSVHGDLTHVG